MDIDISETDPEMPGESRATITTEAAEGSDETPEGKAERARVVKILTLARKRMRTWLTAEQHFHTNAKKDSEFAVGTWGDGKSFQWPSGVMEDRVSRQRPCITVNRMPAFIQQVTNQARGAHLTIQVNPVGDKGDPKTAEVIQGIIHNIETQSYADRAYNTCSDKQAEQGRSYFKLVTEWCAEEGADAFKQRIRIEEVRNPLAIGIDPAAKKVDKTDADYGFELTDVDRETFKDITDQEAPNEEALAGEDAAISGDWFPNGKVRLARYLSRENVGPRKRLAQLSNGDVIGYPDKRQTAELAALTPALTVKRDRWVQKKHLVSRLISATGIYEETIWPADAMPWIEVIGKAYEIDGVKDFRGVVRDSKGPAQQCNVQHSGLLELVGLEKKSTLVGYRGQFGPPDSPMRKAWETDNTNPHAFLEVELIEINGKVADKPSPMNYSPSFEGVLQALEHAEQALNSTAGFHEDSMGERGPRESKEAVLARMRQDQLGSSHYLDNLRFGLVLAGRQLIQLIRAVMDVPQVVRIVGNDEQERSVMVFSGAKNDPRNEAFLQPHPQAGLAHPQAGQPDPENEGQAFPPVYPDRQPFQLPDGVKDIFDLSVGEFHVEVSAGPGGGARRQEAVEAMTSVFKGLPPELSSKFLDLYFKVMDFPMAAQLAERAKKLLPPGLQDDEDGARSIPPQAQAQIQGLEQKLQELMQAYQQAQQKIATDEVKQQGQVQIKQLEFESKERIAAMTEQAALAVVQAKLNGEAAFETIKGEIAKLRTMVELSHEERMARMQSDQDHSQLGLEHAHTTTERIGGEAHETALEAMKLAHAATTPPAVAPDPNAEGATDAAPADSGSA